MRRLPARWVALGLFGLAAVVFTLLELTLPGLLLLAAALVIGVYAIASPELLSARPDETDEEAFRGPPR
jgi:uncharacterized membrane protein HdeD (DUF308 family)